MTKIYKVQMNSKGAPNFATAKPVACCSECVHWEARKYFCKMFKVGTPAGGYCYMGEGADDE